MELSNNRVASTATATNICTTMNSMAPVAQITESSSANLHAVDVKSSVVSFSKFDRGLLSQSELAQYKRTRRNQQRQQSRHTQRQLSSSWNQPPRKPYKPIRDKPPVEREKQRASWKKSKALRRQRPNVQELQAAADLDARRQVVRLQVQLENLRFHLNQVCVSSSKGTPEEILSLQASVDICSEDLSSKQHLVDCHRDAAGHDVFHVMDHLDADCGLDKIGSDYDDSNEIGSDDSVSGDNTRVRNVVSSGEVSCAIAGRGTCSRSAITLCDDGFDPSSPIPISSHPFREQKRRFASAMDRVLCLTPAHSSDLVSSNSFGFGPRESSRIAESRAIKLSCIKPTNCQGLKAWRRFTVPMTSDPVCSLVTFKNMDDSRDGSTTNTMSSRDFTELLTTRSYVTDASIYICILLFLRSEITLCL
jgi:hypothetical protein